MKSDSFHNNLIQEECVMKRFLSLLLAATLLLSLAACGGSVSGDAGIGNLIGNLTDNSSSTPKVS